jgi:hypothetical protein
MGDWRCVHFRRVIRVVGRQNGQAKGDPS